jgi:hypothetical protein
VRSDQTVLLSSIESASVYSDALGVGWLRQLRQCWDGGCVLADCWLSRRHGMVFSFLVAALVPPSQSRLRWRLAPG